MRYNQNKKSALKVDNPLGMRYQGLLRCITHVCKQRGYSFKDIIGRIDTGLKTEFISDIASSKIIKCIELLDIERVSVGAIFRRTKKNIEIDERNIEFSFGNVNNFNHKKKFHRKFRSFIIFEWKFLFGIKRLHKTPLSRRDINIIFRPQYNELTPLLNITASDLDVLLKKKLKHINSKLAFQPQYRNKSWDSIFDKITDMSNKGKKISSLVDIQDLIGFRVVTLFEKDLHLIEIIVEKSLRVVRKYQPHYLTGNEHSKHIIVKVPTKKSKYNVMDENPPFILIEIQIMTLSQFVYASVSHSLLYKNNPNNTDLMKSSLEKIHTLLEGMETELNNRLENKDKK
ncbi:RelA/SpoT domain-containing protein [Yersinia enterocolitica]|uniref:RelA/SpoT domain-containing protein n=1 Tax=Yersinia enterocolitica TaxID=630 RepID=UPI0021B556E1|nr:RelA/SpoT domain-containing protein [Yersinia enterocolitica]UXD29225.1 hypothetical protein FORC066_2013 [Yersinia enterocolitica]